MYSKYTHRPRQRSEVLGPGYALSHLTVDELNRLSEGTWTAEGRIALYDGCDGEIRADHHWRADGVEDASGKVVWHNVRPGDPPIIGDRQMSRHHFGAELFTLTEATNERIREKVCEHLPLAMAQKVREESEASTAAAE